MIEHAFTLLCNNQLTKPISITCLEQQPEDKTEKRCEINSSMYFIFYIIEWQGPRRPKANLLSSCFEEESGFLLLFCVAVNERVGFISK